MATNPYAALAQLRTVCNISDTNDDVLLDIALGAASREIDSYCGWRFWQDSAVATRTFHADSPRCCYLFDDEAGDGISTTTGLIVKIDEDGDGTFETTITITTDFILEPVNAALRTPVWPYTEIKLVDNYFFPRPISGRPGVQVTAKFGWPAIPDDITQACLILAHDLWKSKDIPFGVGGNDFGPLRVGEMNRTAKALLADYRKPGIG